MIEYKNDTIVAIATPQGVGGIGIVRISGNEALNIAKKMFSKVPEKIIPNQMYLGQINAGEFHDKGFFVYFENPKSFTGEDVVEFQVHGSPIVLQSIVNRAIQLGAKMAGRGEFSQRAFLNGKMSLDEAESLISLINSTSIEEAKATERLLSGTLKKQIELLQNDIGDILAQIDVSFDYPEHDDETQIGLNVEKQTKNIIQKLDNILKTYNHGQLLTNGVNVCIVGKPNVGKSSLLNAILGTDTAIVTDIAGTTTDVIKSSYTYKGIRFNLIDTAGIHEGKNVIENLGIEKSKQQLELADLIVFLLDNSQSYNNEDDLIWQLVKDKKHLVVLNKSDLKLNNETSFGDAILISTKNLTDVENLKNIIYDYTIDNNIAENDLILINNRHYTAITYARDILQNILASIGTISLDCIAVDFHSAWSKLGEIVGNTDIEGIIDKIFSKFCLGK